MDLRKSSITADILNAISDGKVHTLQEIADEVECSKSTVKRHIQSLSLRYPIQTFHGGERKGGVYLDKRFMEQGKMRSNDELQLIRQGLELLQKSGLDVDQKKLSKLLKEYTLPTKLQEKGEANENGNVN